MDNQNPTFYIKGIEEYPNNKLQVFNRWGVMVYETKGYDNTWEGISTRSMTLSRGDKLPIGTYYYSLDLGNGSELIIGWLYINN